MPFAPARRAIAGVLVTTGTVALLAAAPAPAATRWAPIDQAGPKLRAKAVLTCGPGVARATRTPVLLVPGTGVTAAQSYSWNWQRSLTAAGIPWCSVTPPTATLADIQRTGELVADAIRRVQRTAKRRIAILGHSQGGLSPRWALRFFPDTRAKVSDVIAIGAPQHGTTLVPTAECRAKGCAPAIWQQARGSRFLDAVNSRAETFRGISYTNVWSTSDAVVMPAGGNRPTSALRTGRGRITNVAVQEVCPAEKADHLSVGLVSATTYALAIDALDRDGPANPGAVARAVCSQPYQPGVDLRNPDTYRQLLSATDAADTATTPGVNKVSGLSLVKREPALRSYVKAKRKRR